MLAMPERRRNGSSWIPPREHDPIRTMHNNKDGHARALTRFCSLVSPGCLPPDIASSPALAHPTQPADITTHRLARAQQDLNLLLARNEQCPFRSMQRSSLTPYTTKKTWIFNHDASHVQERLGPLGLAGFFCNGEIGPVGEKNFLHGYTASLALFVKKS